jgi:hypothetical protein
MKDKTMAILIWTAVGLVVCGLFINLAVDIFGTTQDAVITGGKGTENY